MVKITPWALEYISIYPRSPFELPKAVLTHAYGEARPITMPEDIDDSEFKLLVAETPYNKRKGGDRLQQTHHKASIHGATHATDALVSFQNPSASPTPQPPMMNAGPFDAMIQASMHAAQSMGSQTGGHFQNLGFQNKAFRSRVPIIVGKQAFNQPAVDGEQPAAEDKENEDKEDEDEEDEDDLEKLETALAIATKKEAQVRKAKQLADKKKKLKKMKNTLRRHCQRNLQLREGKPRKQRRKGKGKRRGEKGKGKRQGKGNRRHQKRMRKRQRQQERNHPANSISPVGLRRT